MLVAMAGYVCLAPYSKVEESFNIQAVHDLIAHPLDLAAFDHHIFPGVVPRTFIGPILLALIASPPLFLARLLRIALPPPRAPLPLILTRLMLGVATVSSLVVLRRAVAARFNRTVAHAFALLHVLQFHILFYASRTLPNTFALILVNFSLAQVLHPRGNFYRGIAILSFACALFRSELCILIFTTILGSAVLSPVPLGPTFLPRVIQSGLVAAIGAALLSICVDSYFWRRLAYPELEVFYFNAVLNKSSGWGTEPFHWYFTHALPKALGPALPFMVLGLAVHPRDVGFAIAPSLAFVAIYSILPHKELRFIFYAIPPCNIAAATGVDHVVRHVLRLGRRKTARFYKARIAAVVALLFICICARFGMTLLSVSAAMFNYPGGAALSQLQAIELSHPCRASSVYRVHIDVDSAMSGVTQFLERRDGGAQDGRLWGFKPACPERLWIYSRREDLAGIEMNVEYTHLVTNRPTVPGFDVLTVVQGFSGIQRTANPPWFTVRTSPHTYVHIRTGL